jgi:hypothetical protein
MLHARVTGPAYSPIAADRPRLAIETVVDRAKAER